MARPGRAAALADAYPQGTQPGGPWEPTSCRGALRFASPLWSPGGGIERIQSHWANAYRPGEPLQSRFARQLPQRGANGRPPCGEPGTVLSPCRGGAGPRPAGRPGRYRSLGRMRTARESPFSLALLDSSPRGGANGRPPQRKPGSLPSPCRGGACPRPAGRPKGCRNLGRTRTTWGRSKRGSPLLGVSIRVGLGRGRNRNLPLPSVVSLWFFLFGQAKRKKFRPYPRSF